MDKKKILLVDDSKTQLNTLKILFKKSGFDVVTADDAASAYPLIFSEAPDLVVSDIIMPNLNGYQFCRLIKNNRQTSKIPVILLTVLEQKMDKFWGKASGAQLFISKNSDFEKIANAAVELCELYPVSNKDKNDILNENVNQDLLQSQLNSILDDTLQESIIMNEFRLLTEFLENEKAMAQNIFSLLASLLDYNCACLFFNNIDEKDRLLIYYDVQKQNICDELFLEISKRTVCEALDLEVCRDDNFANTVFLNHTDEKTITSYDAFKTKYFFPIYFENKLLGVLAMYNTKEKNYNQLKFMRIIESELLLLMRIKRLYSQTIYLSVTDTLTGLYNRRYLSEYLQREYSRTQRYKGNFSVAIVDLDKFKSVNDTYGHQIGDFVLKTSAKILSSIFRKTDMIFRYGGEEFIVLLPETTKEQAIIPFERYRRKMEEHIFSLDDISLKVTASIGIADNSIEIDEENTLIKNADSALYEAKNTGRNKVVVYDEK